MPHRASIARASVRFSWRWLTDAPLLHAVWLCVLAAMFVVLDVSRALDQASRLNARVSATAAITVAEEAASHFAEASDGVAVGDCYESLVGQTCRIDHVQPDGTVLLSVETAPGTLSRFAFDRLSGRAPEAFSLPLSCRADPVPPLPAARHPVIAEAPRLQTEVLTCDPSCWEGQGVLQRDDAIALLRFSSGTDRLDFSFVDRAEGGPIVPRVPDSGVVCLDGHLWIDAGAQPLWLELDRNLTLIVRGNVYFGRSLRVTGPGRLFLVTRIEKGGGAFVDRDGDGRRSAGDPMLSGQDPKACSLEGTGAADLGIPGQRPPARLSIDASLVVGGELHLLVDRAEIRGALALGAGITRTAGSEGVVEPSGELLPDIEREAVPGFATAGPPRAGRVRPVRALPESRAEEK